MQLITSAPPANYSPYIGRMALPFPYQVQAAALRKYMQTRSTYQAQMCMWPVPIISPQGAPRQAYQIIGRMASELHWPTEEPKPLLIQYLPRALTYILPAIILSRDRFMRQSIGKMELRLP